MRALRRRKKKLIVALHFAFSNQAGWECGTCRKSGLERKRGCGWLPATSRSAERAVWAGGGVTLETCPKSFVTAESSTWIEEYLIRRRLGQSGIESLGAREVEAFLIVETEFIKMEAARRGGTGAQQRGSTRGTIA